jgi:1-acyl-sn-glycerol-3-phosphate acyltransferase
MKNNNGKINGKVNRLPGTSIFSLIFVYVLLKPFMAIYLRIFHNARFHKPSRKIPKGPVLFIANHYSNWDPFYACTMFYSRHPHILAHDEVFSNRIRRLVFKYLLGQIKRPVINNDTSHLRLMKKYISKGRSVYIFPEGDIGMFGVSLPIDNGITKLAKLLNIPVVCYKIVGAHLRAPRWSRFPHRGRIDVIVTDFINQKEIKESSIKKLHRRISEAIYSDEYLLQSTRKIKVIGNHRSEWLQLGLYRCPRCHNYQTLSSKNNDLMCSHCQLKINVNKYLMFEYEGKPYFKTPNLWDNWQQQMLYREINEKRIDLTIFNEEKISFQMVGIEEFFSNDFEEVTIKLSEESLIINNKFKNILIPYKEMINVRLQYKDVLEIITRDNKYRLFHKQKKWSAYMMSHILKYLSKN